MKLWHMCGCHTATTMLFLETLTVGLVSRSDMRMCGGSDEDGVVQYVIGDVANKLSACQTKKKKQKQIDK